MNNLDTLETIVDKVQKTNEKNFFWLIQTKFQAIDKIIDGLHKGNLIVIASCPGMGKTDLSLNIINNILRDNKKIIYFSLLNENEILLKRLLHIHKNIKELKTSEQYSNFWDSCNTYAKYIENSQLIFENSIGYTTEDLINKAKEIHQKQKLDLIIIDYLQLLANTTNAKNFNAIDCELNSTVISLKTLALELDIPILVTSTVNHNVLSKPTMMPQLHELKNTTTLEDIADIIILIGKSINFGYDDEENNETQILEINVAKNKNGTTGKNMVFHIKTSGKILDLTKQKQ